MIADDAWRLALSITRRSDLGAYSLDDLDGVREPALAVFREYQNAVGDDIEHAVGAFDQLRLRLELLRDLGRQTGGPGQVVSTHAVGDGDMHG